MLVNPIPDLTSDPRGSSNSADPAATTAAAAAARGRVAPGDATAVSRHAALPGGAHRGRRGAALPVPGGAPAPTAASAHELGEPGGAGGDPPAAAAGAGECVDHVRG